MDIDDEICGLEPLSKKQKKLNDFVEIPDYQV